jgi:hypothetical protein
MAETIVSSRIVFMAPSNNNVAECKLGKHDGEIDDEKDAIDKYKRIIVKWSALGQPYKAFLDFCPDRQNRSRGSTGECSTDLVTAFFLASS